MPQMSPLMWLILYAFILFVMILTNVLISYLYISKKDSNLDNIFFKKKFIWKW